jgi:ribose 1,5-bisphosphokinase PhnN
MALWGGYEGGTLFSSREFNSLAGNGAFGVYAGMADGYDVQVRRHLAFGSPVVCNQDRDVIGDLADLCVQNEGEMVRVERVKDGVRERDYLDSLDEIIGML